MTLAYINLIMTANNEESMTSIKSFIESNITQECCSSDCPNLNSSIFFDDILNDYIYNFSAYIKSTYPYEACISGLSSQLDALDKTDIKSIRVVKVADCNHDGAQSNTPCVPEYVYVWRV